MSDEDKSLMRAMIDDNFEVDIKDILTVNVRISLEEQVSRFMGALQEFSHDEHDNAKNEHLFVSQHQETNFANDEVSPSTQKGSSSDSSGSAPASNETKSRA